MNLRPRCLELSVRRLFGLVLVSVLLPSSLPAPSEGREPSAEEVEFAEAYDPILERSAISFGIPGVAVAIVKEDRVLYARAFGVRNLDSGESLSLRSLFHQASVTKPFVATSVVQLVERGKIDLDAPVVTYLPYFRIDDEHYDRITVRQMLRHVSGMPDVEDYEWDRPQYDDGALERFVRSLGDKKLISPPGTRQRYSNMAFEVLGDVIAKVSGKSFEDFVAENTLEPLKMNDTTLLKKRANRDLLTSGHVRGDSSEAVVSGVYPYNRRHSPSSTLISNLPDMCRWARANLNKGILDGKRILKESSYRLLFEPHDSEFSNIGLSWFLGRHRGFRTVGHSGSDTGYRSQFTMIPEKAIAVVVMSNYSRTPVGELGRAALDLALGIEPQPILKPLQKVLLQIIERRGSEPAIARYRRLRRVARREMDFGEGTLIGLARILVRDGKGKEAKAMLGLNLEVYADSWRTHSTLAEIFVGEKDREKALFHYRAARELRPEDERILERIKALELGG